MRPSYFNFSLNLNVKVELWDEDTVSNDLIGATTVDLENRLGSRDARDVCARYTRDMREIHSRYARDIRDIYIYTLPIHYCVVQCRWAPAV